MAQMRFKSRKVNSGDLRTPVIFYEFQNVGPYPDDVEKAELFKCFAETYSPSMKDREILGVTESTQGLTIVIRDPIQSYTPRPKHVVKVEDYRLETQNFDIYDIRLDTPERGYITLTLGEKK